MTREIYRFGEHIVLLTYRNLEERLQQINTYANLGYINEEDCQ